MSNSNIEDFYKNALENHKFSSELIQQIPNISNKSKLKEFIEEKIYPIAKSMGYNFTSDELLSYELETVRVINEDDLENITGGARLKDFIIAGAVSLFAIGAGALLSAPANAELNAEAITQSYGIMIDELKKDIPEKKANEKSQTPAHFINSAITSEKSTVPIEQPTTNTSKTTKSAVDEQQSSSEKKTIDASSATEINDLKTTQTAAKTQAIEKTVTSKSLTPDQKLYALEALNMPEAYTLLQSGVINNGRFCMGISNIALNESGLRQYSEDTGNAISEVLFQLFPSPSGTLNTAFNGDRLSFAQKAITPETMAKLCAILNDYRNDKMVKNTNQKNESNIYFDKSMSGKQLDDFWNFYGLNDLTSKEQKRIEEIRTNLDSEAKEVITAKTLDAMKIAKTSLSKILSKITKGENINSFKIELQTIHDSDINDSLKEQIAALLNAIDLQDKKSIIATFPKIKEIKTSLDDLYLQFLSKNNYIEKKQAYEKNLQHLNELNSKVKNEKERYRDFIKLLFDSITDIKSPLIQERDNLNDQLKQIDEKLSVTINRTLHGDELQSSRNDVITKLADINKQLSDTKYFVEKVLISYMIKTLNTQAEIKTFYSTLTQALAKNKSNQLISIDIAGKNQSLEDKKEKLTEINTVINAIETEKNSPYKNKTYADGLTNTISFEKDKIKFNINTFADCADTALRHVINLLSYSENQNWDKILHDVNEKTLLDDLDKVKKAINEQSSVEFFNLKKRLQIFFLYQKNNSLGVDDQSKLARTLWEYAICNMDKEKADMYDIKYVDNKGYELDTGYINMMKAMWNIANALELGQEKVIDGDIEKTKLQTAKDAIYKLGNTEIYEIKNTDETIYALKSVFSLFATNKITVNKNDNNQITVNCNNSIFDITQINYHAYVTHIPIKLIWNDTFYQYANNSCFAALLTKKLASDKLFNQKIGGFYGAFSGEKLDESDIFAKNTLYKKYTAVITFQSLQDEGTDDASLGNTVTKNVLDGSKLIQVNQLKNKLNLSDILYRQFLSKYDGGNTQIYELFNTYFKKQQAYQNKEKIAGMSYIKLNNTEVKLFISNEAINNDELHIPSKICDTEGNELSIIRVAKLGNDSLDCAKVIFDDNFESLAIDMNTFINNEKLNTCIFPNSLTKLIIGDYAFKGCINLKLAFAKMNNLKKLHIGFRACDSCNSLAKLDLSNLETLEELDIKESAFINCATLTDIVFSKNVKKLNIDKHAFRACATLTNLDFSNIETLEELNIGQSAFSDCTSLTDITFSRNAKKINIGANTFRDCSTLTNLDLSNLENLYELNIGENAFSDCTSLTDIAFSKNIKKLNIDNSAFRDCSALTNLDFSEAELLDELNIGESAFSNTALTDIAFSKNIKKLNIDNSAFRDCSALTNLDFSKAELLDELNIGESAFSNCATLTDIVFSKNVKKLNIDKHAFRACATLTKLDFSNIETLEELNIGQSAFSDCTSLTDITFSRNAKKINIGANTFRDCSTLTNLDLSNLENLYELNIGENAFSDCTSLTDIAFSKNIKELNIGNSAFRDCSALTKLEFSNTEMLEKLSIGYCALGNCSALTKLDLSNAKMLKELSFGEFALYNCTALTDIIISQNFKKLSIEKNTFFACTATHIIVADENTKKLLENNRSDYGIADTVNIVINTAAKSTV